MFLRNAWYVAAWEHEIGRSLLPTRILGEEIVLYRLRDGRIAALEDACAHRKLPLSMGRLKDDEVECGYHGLKYDCTGICTHVPGSDRIHPGARVRAYPIELRNGLVWIWMGDPAKADRSRIFQVEHYGDPAWGMHQGESMQVDCHYLYMTDNLLDPAHVAFVHPGSFAGAACEDTPLDVVISNVGVTVSRWMKNVPPAPFYAPFLTFDGNCDRKQHYEVHFPSQAIIKAIFVPAGGGGDAQPLPADAFLMDSYNFMTPIDENTTKYYWFQLHNFAPDDAAVSQQFASSVRAAFEEDRVILNAVHRGMSRMQTPNINLKIDAGAMQFRRRLAEMIDAERRDAETVAATARGTPSRAA
jgi:phenylpropionate dioxygenase-like ring-hydroxylating dioxygenase large terminal subunit